MGWLALGRSIVHGGSSQSNTSMNGPRYSRRVSVLIDHTSFLLVPTLLFERRHSLPVRGERGDRRGPSALAHRRTSAAGKRAGSTPLTQNWSRSFTAPAGSHIGRPKAVRGHVPGG